MSNKSIIAFIHFRFPNALFGTIVILGFIILPVLLFIELKWTIQRLYDLNLSGWYILLTWIPIFSIIFTIYLFVKKGKCEINEFDKAINYRKSIKNKHCIDIHDKILSIDDEELQYERYLGKYIIKISKYGKENIFSEYLIKNYKLTDEQIYRTVEITKEEFYNIIETLDLVIILNSYYIKIKGYELFIRNEDFKYTIILDKTKNNVSKELYDIFDFPGSYYEDENYIYYNGIDKTRLKQWINNVA